MTTKRQSSSEAKKKSAAKKAAYRPVIHADMNVMDVIALHPGAAGILGEYGLHCFQCAFNTLDSVEAGARTHGLTDTDIENIVIDLQELIDATAPRPQTITLTTEAAQALKKIAKAEGKDSIILRVTTDQSGGFCMEFEEKVSKADRTFTAPGIDDVSVVASDEVLWKVGGATIDFKDGRFKLETDEACGCADGSCGCGKK